MQQIPSQRSPVCGHCYYSSTANCCIIHIHTFHKSWLRFVPHSFIQFNSIQFVHSSPSMYVQNFTSTITAVEVLYTHSKVFWSDLDHISIVHHRVCIPHTSVKTGMQSSGVVLYCKYVAEREWLLVLPSSLSTRPIHHTEQRATTEPPQNKQTAPSAVTVLSLPFHIST